MKIFSIIQARGGSKRIPKKNLKLLGGYPLIAYSIAASRLCKSVQRTIVSTDSKEIARVAKKYGAEVPFMRPAKFAQDHSTDLDVFSHAIKWLEKEGGSLPDLLVQLRPTTPLRDPVLIGEAIKKIKNNPQANSLRSAHQVGQPPQKMFQISTAGFWNGFFPNYSQLFGPKIFAFITPHISDIDHTEDIEHAEYILQKNPNPLFDYLSKNFPQEKKS